jgi:hypothetical protein
MGSAVEQFADDRRSLLLKASVLPLQALLSMYCGLVPYLAVSWDDAISAKVLTNCLPRCAVLPAYAEKSFTECWVGHLSHIRFALLTDDARHP